MLIKDRDDTNPALQLVSVSNEVRENYGGSLHLCLKLYALSLESTKQ